MYNYRGVLSGFSPCWRRLCFQLPNCHVWDGLAAPPAIFFAATKVFFLCSIILTEFVGLLTSLNHDIQSSIRIVHIHFIGFDIRYIIFDICLIIPIIS